MVGGSKHEFRLLLYLAQQGECIWCGKMMNFDRKKRSGAPGRDFATFEHIKRRDEGGAMSADNIVLAHRKCNDARNIEHQARRAALGE